MMIQLYQLGPKNIESFPPNNKTKSCTKQQKAAKFSRVFVSK